jgi:Family of unknown function (DUF6174)
MGAVRRPMKRSAMLAALVVLTPALGSQADDQQALVDLDRAEALWKKQALTHMSYMLLTSGAFGGSFHRVHIRGETCKSIWRSTHSEHDGVWRSESCEGNSIPELFAALRLQLLRGTESVSVKFNAKYGYIQTLSLEPKTDLTDQSWYVEMRSFRIDNAR